MGLSTRPGSSFTLLSLISSNTLPAVLGIQQAERTIQTVKWTLKKASDPYIALLNTEQRHFPGANGAQRNR